MRYLATIHAVDVMTTVSVTVSIRAQESSEHTWETVRAMHFNFPGTGEDDPTLWIRDVCIAVLEAT